MYDRFTDRARKVMQLANQEAQRFNHEYIGTEHVLIGLLKEGSGFAANVLKGTGLDLRKIRTEVEKIFHVVPNDNIILEKLPHTQSCKEMVEFSIDEAHKLNHNYVGTEHILLGLLRGENHMAITVLKNLGIKIDNLRVGLIAAITAEREQRATDQNPIPAVPGHGLNVTGFNHSQGYYYRLESDAGCFEIGFKTHDELMAYIASCLAKATVPDEPIIK